MTVEDKQTETKFPSLSLLKNGRPKEPETMDELCIAIFNKSIQCWFKRCIEDRPQFTFGLRSFVGDSGMLKKRKEWFEKWFSQFDSSISTKITEEE